VTRVIGSARPSVRGVAVSEEGIPVRRATVTVTDVATSLPAVIYSDAALTTTTANPMTTDADGVYEFWVPDGTYSLAYAGLARMPAPEQVAVVSGFSAPPGTHAAISHLPFVLADDYLTGTRTDLQAISAAESALGGFGRILLSSRTWDIGNASVGIPLDGPISIEGAGQGKTALNYRGTGVGVLVNTGIGVPTVDAALRHLTLSTATGAHGVTLGDVTNSPHTGSGTFEDVEVTGFSAAGIRALYVAYLELRRCYAHDNGGDGLLFDNVAGAANTTALLLGGRYTNNGGRGLHLKCCSAFKAVNAAFETNALEGSHVHRETNADVIQTVEFDACYYERNNLGRGSATPFGQQSFVSESGASPIGQCKSAGCHFTGVQTGTYNILIDRAAVIVHDPNQMTGGSYISASSVNQVTIYAQKDPNQDLGGGVLRWNLGPAASGLAVAHIGPYLTTGTLHAIYVNSAGTWAKVLSLNTSGIVGALVQGSAIGVEAPTGRWTATGNGPTTSSSIVAGDMRVMPLDVPTGHGIASLAMLVTAASAGSTYRLVVLDSDGSGGQPGTTLYDSGAAGSTVDGNSTNAGAPQEIVASLSAATVGGKTVYVGAVMQGTGAPTVEVSNVPGSHRITGESSAAASATQLTALKVTGVTGALAGSYSASTFGAVGLGYRVQVKFS
jgi:hypothetical protein